MVSNEFVGASEIEAQGTLQPKKGKEKSEKAAVPQNETVAKVLGDKLTESNLVVGIKLPKGMVEAITSLIRRLDGESMFPTDECVNSYLSKASSQAYTMENLKPFDQLAMAWQGKQYMRVRMSIEKLKNLEPLRLEYAKVGMECSQEFALTLIILRSAYKIQQYLSTKRNELTVQEKMSDEDKGAALELTALIKAAEAILR